MGGCWGCRRGGNPSVVVNSRPERAGLINRKKKIRAMQILFFQFPNNTKKEGNPKKYRVVILN